MTKFNKNNNNKFLKLFTNSGIKVIQLIFFLLFLSASMYAFDNYYLKKKCKLETGGVCLLSPFMSDLSKSILQSAILIFFFEIGFKQQTLEEMRKIFISTQPTKNIKGFYSKRADYKRLIEDSFDLASSRQEIKILCLSEEEVSFFQQQNLAYIRDKIIEGCQIKVLILHPSSCLLDCLHGVNFADKPTQQSLLEMLAKKLKQLVKMLEQYKTNNNNIKGTFEVRLHKDLYSSIGYYSDSRDCHIVWMYFSDYNNGNKYPAFHISNKDLIDDTDRHFETLWEKSKEHKLEVKKDAAPNNTIPMFNFDDKK